MKLAEVESRTQGSRPRTQNQGQPFRGQTLSKPRTGMLEAKDTSASALQKKRNSQKFFRRSPKKKKVFTKIFQAICTKKRFPKNFSSTPQNFKANFRGLEASRPRPRTLSSRPRPRTSKSVLEDSTFGNRSVGNNHQSRGA